MNIYIQGLLLGLAYVAPIGMQNLYVIQSALQGYKKQCLYTTFFIILNDVLLACACYFGIGNLLMKFPQIKFPLALAGVLIMLYIAYGLWNSSSKDIAKNEMPTKISAIFMACIAVTWFNPQAIIDGTILFGGIRSTLTANNEHLFILGFTSASVLWFTTISVVISLTKKAFTKRLQLMLNKICAVILVLFSIKLAINLVF